ncbi:putative TIR-NBS type disease resistance protein [Klebsormidium nitens]|uniref:Putative TIR-NBS type disease resistance protein n=1 Tax=Klebsormidium nitens TaxID=105231 RepID=A0A1Y1I2Q6_KLENI|nr:putative TIR-NBS type disease resistance protein [Klebsormidium nitens]|eukprot:GAQ85215.1 putative TIR-NBS type disease resistance protein [Klebsormidium nitens]
MDIHEERAESSGAGPSHRAAGVAYDVFISHCGADCKRDFAVQLKNELERAGLCCFLDDRDLRLEDDAAKTICAAMETTKFGVVLVTEGFFKREWRIKELETFLRRGNCTPVFLERSMERQGEIVEECRSSRVWEGFGRFLWSEEEYLGLVKGVFGFVGLRLDASDGFWDTCFAKLKQELLLQLGRIEGPPMLPEPSLLVGMEEHVEAVKVLMGFRTTPQSGEGGSAQEVGIVGVKGMGGVGKTTLAKLVYNDKEVRAFFGKRVCWLEVNQKPSQEKVCKLQEQILQALGDAGSVSRIADPTVGRAEIRKALQSGAPVLICLDNVWVDGHTPVVFKEDLSPGSCILKTTRDANTIAPGGQKHDLDVLSPEDAERLFRATALRGQEPSAEVEALIGRTLPFCAGLPLALEVVGASVARLLTKEDGISLWETLLAAMSGASVGVVQTMVVFIQQQAQ